MKVLAECHIVQFVFIHKYVFQFGLQYGNNIENLDTKYDFLS